MSYARALAAWGDAGGYDAEVLWDVCTTAALGMPFDRCGERPQSLRAANRNDALEALLRGGTRCSY